jgi:hypothetical protein
MAAWAWLDGSALKDCLAVCTSKYIAVCTYWDLMLKIGPETLGTLHSLGQRHWCKDAEKVQ